MTTHRPPPADDTPTPRIAIVGARRAQQGLGPFVARDLHRAGVTVACFLATSAASRDAARDALERTWGIDARGYLDLDTMLETESLDALAILSPAETHAHYLEAALEAGLHVLCEKPFVWGSVDLAADTQRITQGFDARELSLWENCQWPYALPAYAQLFPEIALASVRRFEMLLQPSSGGVECLGDALPHALSLLQAVAPEGPASVEGIRFTTRDAGAPAQVVRFEYHSGGRTIDVTVRLHQNHTARPRRARLALDGREAERAVAGEDYRMVFRTAERSVPVDDPLTLLVEDFARALQRRAGASRSGEIAQRMQLLGEITEAYGASAP